MKTKKNRSRRRTKRKETPAVAFFSRETARFFVLFSDTRREEGKDFPPHHGKRRTCEKKRRRKSFTAARAQKKKSIKIAPKTPLFSTRRRIVRNETTFAFWRSEIVRTRDVISRFLGDWMEPAAAEQKSRHLVERAFFSFIARGNVSFFSLFFWFCVCLSKTLRRHKHKHVLTARLSHFPL